MFFFFYFTVEWLASESAGDSIKLSQFLSVDHNEKLISSENASSQFISLENTHFFHFRLLCLRLNMNGISGASAVQHYIIQHISQLLQLLRFLPVVVA